MSDSFVQREAPFESDHFARPATFLTADVPGTGGVIRQRPEDFVVEEIPLAPPAGTGEHVVLFIQKVDLTTEQVARMLCEHFGVRREAVGYAGQKDRRAVTRQAFSVYLPGRRIESFRMIEHERVSVLWVDRHTSRLERGHLAGNRFSIRIRDVEPTAAPRAARSLRTLDRLGVPNRVGIQRFGSRENNHLVGREIFCGRAAEAIGALLGPPAHGMDPHAEAWALAAHGAFREAARRLPASFRVERAVLEALARGDSPGRAMSRIAPSDKGFLLSAFQSAVFNRVLDARIAAGLFGQAVAGDVLVRDGGDEHHLLAADVEPGPEQRERLVRDGLVPSGPMWGVRMPRAAGRIAVMELEALRAFGLSPDDLQPAARAGIPMSGGTRRPLWVRLSAPDVEGGFDEHGPYIRCAFDLPRGAFATEVMREIMKTPVEEMKDA